MEKTPGKHLSAIRGWIQRKALNGENVLWNSNDKLKFREPITVVMLENLAQKIRNSIINEGKVNLSLTLLEAKCLSYAAGNTLDHSDASEALFNDINTEINAALRAAKKLKEAIKKAGK